HQRLGSPTFSLSLGLGEDYPHSGVSVSFNPEGHVSQLWFIGEADRADGPVGAAMGPNWIQSDRPLVFGLAMSMNEDECARVRGRSVRDVEEGTLHLGVG